MNPLKRLEALGQSIWLDDIGRGMLESGELAALIEQDGVSGVTSNPAIFEKAITDSHHYDEAVALMKQQGVEPVAIYEELAIEDIRRTADLFRPVFNQSNGRDGFVSLEVSPYLANDTEKTVSEARRLWARVERPNALVKIPATDAGVPAIRDLIAEGININITLIFSIQRYRQVVEAFLGGLEMRVKQNQPVENVVSFASFFLSRIDVMVDKQLDELAARTGNKDGKTGAPEEYHALRGQAAIAAALNARQYYLEWTGSQRWKALSERGARPQRLLWASTGTKDPAYSNVKYVESLIASDTVTTLPRETLEAYRKQGNPVAFDRSALNQARSVTEKLAGMGIDPEQTGRKLEAEGVQKFIIPFDKLIKRIAGWQKE